MISDNVQLSGVCVSGDESAAWRCAGLRQVDRLLLGLNAAVGNDLSPGKPLPVCIIVANPAWAPSLPSHRLPRLRVLTDVNEFARNIGEAAGAVAVLPTRMIVEQDVDLADWLGLARAGGLVLEGDQVHSAITAGNLTPMLQDVIDRSSSLDGARRLNQQSELRNYEDELLCTTGKTQDGFISRYLNRPISRGVTRILLRFPISPNQVTIALMLLPLIGLMFLTRGSYWAFVVGALFFQLHSALDGCDGEIARVKYLQSEVGAKLDEICDRLSSLIYAIGLGIGLNQETAQRGYLLEGVAAAVVIGIGESLLTRKPLDLGDNTEVATYEARRGAEFNRGDQLKLWIMRHSRMLAAGERFTDFFSQMTKRDVFNFGFFVLALLGRAAWVLHIFGACALIILGLAVGRLFTALRHQNSATTR